MDFLAISGCKTHFNSELRRIYYRLQIDQDKLRIKFSALNVDFNSTSPDFLDSRNPAHQRAVYTP